MRIQSSLLTIAAALAVVPHADADSRKPKPATRADIDRLEQKIAAQRKLIESLVRAQQEYAAAVAALVADPNATPKIEAKVETKPDVAKPEAPKPDVAKPEARESKAVVRQIKREPTEKPTGAIT